MDGDTQDLWVELVRMIPSLLWFGLAAAVLFKFRRRLEDVFGQLTSFEAMGVKVVCMRESIDAAIELAEKSPKWQVNVPPEDKRVAVERARSQHALIKGAQFLWVDDQPENNINERRMFRQLDVDIDSVTDNERALAALANARYDLVISDVGRPAGAPNGLDLAQAMQASGSAVPLVLYVGDHRPELGVPPHAFAITNRPDQLLHLAFDVLARRPVGGTR